MTTIKSLAERVQNDLEHKQQVFLDPATIMMIMALTEAVIKGIKACRDAKEAKKVKEQQQLKVTDKQAELIAYEVRHPTEREKRQLKRIVRKEIGFVKYWKEGDKYTKALLETGKGVSAQEIKDSFEEINGKTEV